LAGANLAAGGAPGRAACLIATCHAWESAAFLPSLLVQAGLQVEALSPGLVGLSPFVSRHVRCSRQPSEAARELARQLSHRRYDWIIVADEDLLAAATDSMQPREYRSWFPAEAERSAIVSKYSFLERMTELGVNVPTSRFVQTAEEAAEWMLELQVPLVVKGDRGFGGREVRIVTDVEDLRSAVAAFAPAYGRVLVQQFIRGDNVSASVLYQHGEPIAWKACRTSCCYPDAHSASTLHESIDHPELEGIIRAVGAATGFHGFAGLDFVVDSKSSELFLLELNPRPTLGLAGARANRRFFEPAVRAFVSDAPAGEVRCYTGAPTQAYFPSYLFYASSHPRLAKLSHLLLCFSEMRLTEWRLWSWLIARSVKNVLGRLAATPALVSFAGLPAPASLARQRSNS
jgi:phosphoribosylaminoimidazole carboxylase (NCAIR synthetase)